MFAVKCHDDMNCVFFIFKRDLKQPVTCINKHNQPVDLYEAGVRQDAGAAALELEAAASSEKMVEILAKHASDRWTYEVFNAA